MYRCVTYITIFQKATTDFPLRKTVLNFDFVTEFENSDGWRDLTNNGKITLPKNLYYRDQNNKLQPLNGTNINVGGFSKNTPTFLRGDKVTIRAGYRYYNKEHREIEDTSLFFEGYISKVESKIPIVLHIEDNMWVLKQTPLQPATFNNSNTLEDILQYIVSSANSLYGTSFTTFAITKAGAQVTHLNQSIIIGVETASQLLQRLQRSFGLEFYFKGNELRGGLLVYIPSEAVNHNFHFQENIISDELEYQRKEDVILSCHASNMITENEGFCKDGSIKTKKKKLEVLVTIINNPKIGGPLYTTLIINQGDRVPPNIEGERLDFHGIDGNTHEEIAANAYKKLATFYYTGFHGTFTTFGIPFVAQGDNAVIVDKVLPERNGTYKVKQVDYSGGVNGLRQKIHLDYLLTPNNL